MSYRIERMDKEYAIKISKWTYPKPYDFYNLNGSTSSVTELLTEPYFTLFSEENEWLGFFCLGKAAQVPAGHQHGVYADHEQFIDLGLGMRPELTGKGFGYEFFSIILEDVRKKYPEHTVRLTVAAFNLRAIKLYERCGFAKEKSFAGEKADFITMSPSHIR